MATLRVLKEKPQTTTYTDNSLVCAVREAAEAELTSNLQSKETPPQSSKSTITSEPRRLPTSKVSLKPQMCLIAQNAGVLPNFIHVWNNL